MRHSLALAVVLLFTSSVPAAGILIPVERKVPPLAMLNHQVKITIDDQVATTRVEQTFRNHTDRQLEATYIFPVPREASVRRFSMWVNGKEMAGELMEATQARKIYTDIVQRTQDPGLLEYMDHNLFRVRVFPIPPHGEQKLSLSYTSVVPSDHDLISYTYPLKTDGKALETLEKFSITLELKSQHPIQNIYSPTHAIAVTRPSDKQAHILFEKNQAVLDRDFQLYYTAESKDVGLTTITHRPNSEKDGYFMLLVSPRAELAKEQQVPRDVVFVLDTSGSMRGQRIVQARNALKFCLTNLNSQDRFAVINFATTVNKYTDQLLPASSEQIDQARKWVDNLEATGGTAINEALSAALEMRPADSGRTFTLVFFTDGRPTIGETDTGKILKNVITKNSANTRIFTFGVGNDVNASMLDQMAEASRAVSTYVRETETIEDKVSSLYKKISHPVLTGLKLVIDPAIKLSEVYPPHLPDLFHGTQLVVLGRYNGDGEAKVRLTGNVGKEQRDYVYSMNFAKKTGDDKNFVEDLWARRKVGYMLDQIRISGESKELVDEVVALAKRYGITTPYTSYLIVPDEPVPVARRELLRKGEGAAPAVDRPDVRFHLNLGAQAGSGGFGIGGGIGVPGGVPGPTPTGPKTTAAAPTYAPPVLQGAKGNGKEEKQTTVTDFIKQAQSEPGKAAETRGELADQTLKELDGLDRMAKKGDDKSGAKGPKDNSAYYRNHGYNAPVEEARQRLDVYQKAQEALRAGKRDDVQNGYLGVNLSIDSNQLRNQVRLSPSAVRRIQNRNTLNVGGVWIDEAYHAKLKTVTVKALSPAYFRILEKHPEMRDVFRLGNYLVWVTPSNTALVIDTTTGAEEMSDEAIDALFTRTN